MKDVSHQWHCTDLWICNLFEFVCFRIRFYCNDYAFHDCKINCIFNDKDSKQLNSQDSVSKVIHSLSIKVTIRPLVQSQFESGAVRQKWAARQTGRGGLGRSHYAYFLKTL